MHLTRQVSLTTHAFSLSQSFGLVLTQNLGHLADVCEELTGFLGILWISSAKIGNRAICIRIADTKS